MRHGAMPNRRWCFPNNPPRRSLDSATPRRLPATRPAPSKSSMSCRRSRARSNGSPSVIAQVLAGLGASQATALLQQAYELRASDLAWLGVKPTFRCLRTDPAYAALAERLGGRRSHTSRGAGGPTI